MVGYRVNVEKLIDDLGGPKAVSDALEKHKLRPVTAVAVLRWQQRNSIPCHRLADILMMSRKMRRPIEIMDVIYTHKSAKDG